MKELKLNNYMDLLEVVLQNGLFIEELQDVENGNFTIIYTYNFSTYHFEYNNLSKLIKVVRIENDKIKVIFES